MGGRKRHRFWGRQPAAQQGWFAAVSTQAEVAFITCLFTSPLKRSLPLRNTHFKAYILAEAQSSTFKITKHFNVAFDDKRQLA